MPQNTEISCACKLENRHCKDNGIGCLNYGMEKSLYTSIENKQIADDEELLVKELAKIWLMDIKDRMMPSSYSRYQRYTDKYILPYIGEMSAENFEPSILSKTLGQLRNGNGTETPLSQYTVYFLEGMVRSMFGYGTQKNLIPEIRFGKSDYRVQNKKDAIPLSGLEVQQLIHVAMKQGIDFQLQVFLPLYAGLSMSELCGLKWEDIDLEAGKIHVHRNLMRIQYKNGKKTTAMTECELPESGQRQFIIPEKLNKFLKSVANIKKPEKGRYVAELEKRVKGRKQKTRDLRENNTDKNISATPPDARTLQYRLKSAGEAAWIPGLSFQMLRDTFAVMCFNAGGDVYSVAYVLGNNTATVCERYGKWLVKNDGFMKDIG